jgi:predicted amidohydrolase YtcJ
MPDPVELIVRNAKITTGDPAAPHAEALAVSNGRFLAVGDESTIMALKGSSTKVVDAVGRRIIPGLIDSHLHVIRGGLNYNLELRWDGVPSLADAMRLLRHQVARTPPPQWVRVVGGFTEQQFAERRLPTLEELNTVAPHTPVFILHLYDRALLNGAALRAAGYTRDTPDPPGGSIARDARGEPTGLLLAKPNALLLYAALAKGPKLPYEYQINSTRHFMRELNRLGITSVIDAGGGSQNYPEDYRVINDLHKAGQQTIRIAYNLFTQKPKEEISDFLNWTASNRYQQGDDFYKLNGAGEMLVYSAADFEDFRQPRPEMPVTMEANLEAVIRALAGKRWPWRMHATYDETISRALDVFERVAKDIPFDGIHWFFDHAETVSDRSLERIAQLGGGVAIQHRMAYQGEYFSQRYGEAAAERSPPIRKMLDLGIRVGAGTDATRVASYDPWNALYWLVTGKTLGGLTLYSERNRLTRAEALDLYTRSNTWFSNEFGLKGQIATGQLADFAVLSADYFNVPEPDIRQIASVLTVVGGTVVYADENFRPLDPPIPLAMPDWSPTRFGSRYWKDPLGHASRAPAPVAACFVHGHAGPPNGAIFAEEGDFWAGLGCSCWAF